MKALEIYAGEKAAKVIQEQGINPSLFKAMVGASGGPKWFVLAGLDRVVFSEFFKDRTTPLYTLGSSAGAWRFSCFAQKNPLAAINRLAEGYSTTCYSKNASIKEITDKSRQLLNYVLQDNAVEEILANKVIKSNIVVARCHRLTQFDSRLAQLTGLLMAAAANRVSRRYLAHSFGRVVMTSADKNLFSFDDSFGEHHVKLNHDNYCQSLMATGAIPMIISGVKNLSGAPKGTYRDGGIIDYHFDTDFSKIESSQEDLMDNLVLYPHFYPFCKPGWFDKSINSRQVSAGYYDNVVMLSPSKAFVDSLPYGKIPDRKDFNDMDAQTRISYWQKVLSSSDRLGDEFMQVCQHQSGLEKYIKPIFQQTN